MPDFPLEMAIALNAAESSCKVEEWHVRFIYFPAHLPHGRGKSRQSHRGRVSFDHANTFNGRSPTALPRRKGAELRARKNRKTARMKTSEKKKERERCSLTAGNILATQSRREGAWSVERMALSDVEVTRKEKNG